MIRLKKGGVVRETKSQIEAEFYEKQGYVREAADSSAAPDDSEGETGNSSGKKKGE